MFFRFSNTINVGTTSKSSLPEYPVTTRVRLFEILSNKGFLNGSTWNTFSSSLPEPNA